MKKPFVKINIEDLVYAKEFFENSSDYMLWLYAVAEYYQGHEVTIKKKIVKKYFDNYKKTMNIVIGAKEFGKKGFEKRIENQQHNVETLKGYHEGSHKGTHRVNNKIVNNKEHNSIVPFENGTTHEKIDFDGLLMFINKTFGRSFKGILEPVRKKYNARIKEGYKLDDIINAVNNCHKDQFHREHNYKYCTPEFFSRSQTLDKYSETTKQEKIVIASHPYVYD
jgi:uncharacterized phage protein (TIGR02220 family)